MAIELTYGDVDFAAEVGACGCCGEATEGLHFCNGLCVFHGQNICHACHAKHAARQGCEWCGGEITYVRAEGGAA